MLRKCHMIRYEACVDAEGRPTPGAVELIEALCREGLPFLILSDCSDRTPQEVCGYLQSIGFPSFSPDYIYTSLMAAIDWIVRTYPEKSGAAYIGGKGMRKMLSRYGFNLTSSKPDWLFLGLDRNASNPDYEYALSLVDHGTHMISTDSSPIYTINGKHVPGPGALTAMLEYATGQKAILFGRPEIYELQGALRYTGYRKEQVVVIGEDLMGDILPAVKLGLDTVYVARKEGVFEHGLDDVVHPKWIVESLAGLCH